MDTGLPDWSHPVSAGSLCRIRQHPSHQRSATRNSPRPFIIVVINACRTASSQEHAPSQMTTIAILQVFYWDLELIVVRVLARRAPYQVYIRSANNLNLIFWRSSGDEASDMGGASCRILATTAGFITRWTSKNQILTFIFALYFLDHLWIRSMY